MAASFVGLGTPQRELQLLRSYCHMAATRRAAMPPQYMPNRSEAGRVGPRSGCVGDSDDNCLRENIAS